LRQAAHWEIERLTGLPQGEVESDFWVLPMPRGTRAPGSRQGEKPVPHEKAVAHEEPVSRPQEQPGQPTAIGVATEKRTVSGVWTTCEAAGVACRALDTGLCALSRFGSWLRSLPRAEGAPDDAGDAGEAPEIWGLLDLGHSQVRLIICTGNVPVLVRCFDTGGHQWIARISDSLGLSVAAAEVHLRDHGISAAGVTSRGRSDSEGRGVRQDDTPSGAARDVVPSAHLGSIIRNILREELDVLCAEIERSYRYALQCYPQHRASELILVGGGAGMRNLGEYLRSHLGIEVHSAAQRLDGTVMAAGTGAGTPIMRAGAGGRYSVGVLACAIGLAIPP
jgi:Tfp pilus assembly PilM family ATPase